MRSMFGCVLILVGFVLTVDANTRNLLVFGGNGMIGSATVFQLLNRGDNITVINRGNWYWDSKHRIKPHVTHVQCDRNTELGACPAFLELMASAQDGNWDSVIDFSAYSKGHLEDALHYLKDKTRSYVFVSTDSVYDVCDPPHGQAVKEEDARRPDDLDRRQMLNSHHRYAHEKLAAEEHLQELRSSGGPPFVILRMPDVIGPRDTTYRYWIYHTWIKMAPVLPEKPVSYPKFLVDYDNSFVYVDDVASMIEQLTRTSTLPGNVVDQVYNLAWSEPITMDHLLRTVEKHLNISRQVFNVAADSSALYLYPTVRVGPVNVTKAQEKLHWSTTDFDEAIKETVAFYEEVMTSDDYKVQRDEIVQIVINHLYADNPNRFLKAVEKTYGISLAHFMVHDEL